MLVIPNRVRIVVMVMVTALALAAGLLTLALLEKPAQAQAETIIKDNHRSPFIFFESGCTEPVFIEGTQHTVARTLIDANGGFHTKFHFNLQGQGEGLDSGDKYVFKNVLNTHINSPGPFNRTFTQTFKVTRQGSASATDDVQAKVLSHVTVNANGEVSAVVNEFEFVCT
jgi:hypothetical protein